MNGNVSEGAREDVDGARDESEAQLVRSFKHDDKHNHTHTHPRYRRQHAGLPHARTRTRTHTSAPREPNTRQYLCVRYLIEGQVRAEGSEAATQHVKQHLELDYKHQYTRHRIEVCVSAGKHLTANCMLLAAGCTVFADMRLL